MAKPAKPPRIWFAGGSVNWHYSKPISEAGHHYDDHQRMGDDERAAWSARYKAFSPAYRSGLPIAPENLPRRFSRIRNRQKPSLQPFMLFAGVYAVVTAETRALLEGLGPGPLGFHPIEALNTATTAPLWPGAELYLLQVLTCRRAVAIEESGSIGKPIERCLDGEPMRTVSTSIAEDALVVAPPRGGGAEIWIDDRLFGAIFLTDRIAKALKAAKLAGGWGLKRCVTKTVH